jgi:hypothetical protein
MSDDHYMQDWVFHYNIFTEKWAAIPRELYQQYWSDSTIEGVVRSNKIETLISILHKTKGDIDEINKL